MNGYKQIQSAMRLGVLLLLLPVMAIAAEPAGFVLMAKGKVFAVQTDQQLRQLKRKSPFYSGESLKTADNAKAQVRFRDGSLISMRADTEIRIDKFSYQEGRAGGDKNIFTLLSGGFRTITGKIGKKDPKNYRMKSAVASIGVRGTTYEVVLNGGLNVAAWQGTIVVENKGGGITLGAEGMFNFAHVASSTEVPSGKMTPSAAITNNKEAQPDEMQDESEETADQESTDDQGSDDSSADDGTGSDATGGDGQSGADGDGNSGDVTLAAPGGDGDGGSLTNTGDGTNTGGVDLETASTPDGSDDPISNCKIDPATQACTVESIFAAIAAADSSSDVVVEFSDARIEGVTLNRLAMAVSADAGFQNMLAGGKAGLDANGKLFIADSGLHPGEAGFGTTAFTQVLTQGAAPLLGAAPTSYNIDTNYRVDLGVWNATTLTPAQLRTDDTDASIFTAIEQPVYWATATATPAAGLSGRRGVANYRNVRGFIGDSNSGAITDIFMNLSVDFDTATTAGTVKIYTPAELWNLSLDSAIIMGPTLDFTINNGDVNGSDIQGEFSSLFTGDNAQAIISAFDLEAIADPNLHVEGLVLVDDATVGDLRLEGVTLNQAAMYQLVDLGVTGFDRYVGQAGVDGSDKLHLVDNVSGDVLTQGTAPILSPYPYTNATYPVGWGIWDGAAGQAGVLATDANDPTITMAVTQPIHWLTVTPTAAPATGSATYRNVIKADGFGTGGTAITNLFMNLDINFDTTAVLGDAHVYTAANEFWDASLTGNVSGSGLAINSVTGSYSDVANSITGTIDGAVDAMFTGTNAEALAGMLSFEVVGTPSLYVDGMFLLDNTAVADVRLSGVTLDRLGFLFASGVGVDINQSYLGHASDGSSGNPIITDNWLDPGEAGYDTTEPLYVFSQLGPDQAISATTTSAQTFAIDGSHSVSWGMWQGTVAPVYSYESSFDPKDFSVIDKDVYWSTVDLPSGGLPGTGIAHYSNVLGFLGEGQGAANAVTNMYMDLGVNFNTAQVDGKIHIYNTDTWYLDVSGSISSTGPLLYMNVDSGKFNNVAGVNGYVDAAFTGTNGNALLGMFDVEQTSNTNNFVEGMFLVDDTPVQDVRITDAQVADIGTRFGFIAKSNALTGTDIIVGGASSGTDPLFAFNGLLPGDANYTTTPFFEVVSRNGITEHTPPTTHGTYTDVTWGIWSAGNLWGLSDFDPQDQVTLSDPLVWMTVDPTVAPTTGSMTYRNVVAFDGVGTGGTAINDLFMSLDINFDTAAVLGDAHIYTAASEFWDASLTGSVSGSGLAITSVTGLYNNSSAIDGTVDAMFTGASAEALAGMLSFEVTGTPSLYVDSMFLLDNTAVGDLRLTAAEWASLDRVGIAIKDIPSSVGTHHFIGSSSGGSGGSPIFTDNGSLLGDTNYLIDSPLDVVKQGLATTTGLYTNGQVSWGIWSAAAGSEAEVLQDDFDPASSYLVDTDVLWMTLVPTLNSTITGTSGQAQYKASGLNKIGFDNDGDALWTAQFGVHVDFDTAQFKGTGFVEDAGTYDDWRIDFDGSVIGARLDVVNLSGVYNGVYGTGEAIAGDLDMYFVGAAADGLAGAFELEWVSDPTKYVIGAFEGFKDLRLTNAEQVGMDRIGISAVQDTVAGIQLYNGIASDGAGGSPILSQNAFLLSDSRFYSTAPNSIIRQDAATNAAWHITSTLTAYPVSWGAWDAGALMETDYLNPATTSTVASALLWMTVQPTDDVVLAGMTGGARYTNTLSNFVSGVGGAATVDTNVEVDFDTATFNGHTIINETGVTGTWNLLYNGFLQGPELDVSTINGIYDGTRGAGLAIDGDISLFFTGANAEAIAGAVSLEFVSDPAIYVQGHFVTEKDFRLTATEAGHFDRLAVSTWASHPLAVSTDGIGGSPVMVTSPGMLDINKPETWVSMDTLVLKTASVATSTADESYQVGAVDPNFQVNWGQWNSATELGDPSNAGSNSPIATPVFWMTLAPTPATVVTAKTGVVNYSNPIMVAGRDNVGAINSGTFSFTAAVDFDSYTLTAGAMAFDAGGGTWDATFAGTLNGAGISFSAVNPRLNAATGAGGVMSGVLTGPDADGMAGSFNFNGPSTEFVEGVFLVNCLGGGAGCI